MKRPTYWILISLTYLSLIYSTGLHYAYGPESTISLSYFQHQSSYPLSDTFPDLGSLSDTTIDYYGRSFWKLSSFWGDAGYYIIQSREIDESIAPYKYRILPTIVVNIISFAFNMSIEKSFVMMNIGMMLAAALLFTVYLYKDLMFSEMVSFIGGILLVTSVAVTRTLPFPMLEPSSMMFSILIFIAVIRKNPYLFIVSSLCGVMTKEILVVASLMWLIETIQFTEKKKLLKNALISLIPIVVFIIIRLAFGGSALEVNYGFNVLAGEFPKYGKRMFSLGGVKSLAIRSFLSFSFLWLGLTNIRKDAFLKRQSIVIPIVILAAFMLSSRIARVLGILFPIIIPMWLLFFERGSSAAQQNAAPDGNSATLHCRR